jgi:hypothetical protein
MVLASASTTMRKSAVFSCYLQRERKQTLSVRGEIQSSYSARHRVRKDW